MDAGAPLVRVVAEAEQFVREYITLRFGRHYPTWLRMGFQTGRNRT
jgi:hypothetical protein